MKMNSFTSHYCVSFSYCTQKDSGSDPYLAKIESISQSSKSLFLQLHHLKKAHMVYLFDDFCEAED